MTLGFVLDVSLIALFLCGSAWAINKTLIGVARLFLGIWR